MAAPPVILSAPSATYVAFPVRDSESTKTPSPCFSSVSPIGALTVAVTPLETTMVSVLRVDEPLTDASPRNTTSCASTLASSTAEALAVAKTAALPSSQSTKPLPSFHLPEAVQLSPDAPAQTSARAVFDLITIDVPSGERARYRPSISEASPITMSPAPSHAGSIVAPPVSVITGVP